MSKLHWTLISFLALLKHFSHLPGVWALWPISPLHRTGSPIGTGTLPLCGPRVGASLPSLLRALMHLEASQILGAATCRWSPRRRDNNLTLTSATGL